MRKGGACTFEGCTNRQEARGLCSGHRAQFVKGQILRPLKTALPTTLPDDPDERAVLLAKADRHPSPTTRALTRGLGIDRGWSHVGDKAVDAELLRTVEQGAACARSDEDLVTDFRYQTDADPVRGRCMALCPVRELCLWQGRATRAWGLYGGVVLVDGFIAAESEAS
ncbi:hypothetical protein [Georgenia deserti]|uniref:4Fe-4S Wbl-type domain-containing protein n=1 Tax=Georgenia deserti TaxID=2093781 RepID=A0ABW4KZA4_9MICO